MIKALAIIELFQIMKRHIRQSGLNFQKCYERDQNMRTVDRGLRAEGRLIRPVSGVWKNLIANKNRGST